MQAIDSIVRQEAHSVLGFPAPPWESCKEAGASCCQPLCTASLWQQYVAYGYQTAADLLSDELDLARQQLAQQQRDLESLQQQLQQADARQAQLRAAAATTAVMAVWLAAIAAAQLLWLVVV